MAGGELVHRGRVLQRVEQRPSSDAEDVSVELLLAFTRALIRNHPSGDLLLLSAASARREVGASDEEHDALLRAAVGEARQSWLPKGFM